MSLLAHLVALPSQAQSSAPRPAAGEASQTGDDEPAPEETDENAPAPARGIEEIVVTGAAAPPIPDIRTESVVLFDASDIEALGIADVTDLADFTPNLEIVSPGETTATFFIRGVGLQDFSANAPSAVAVYQDGVPMNAPPLQVTQIFDVDNVAVLRGPQGTGVGRNASAGAIDINARKPSLDTVESSLRVGLGEFVTNKAPNALIQDYEGALGLPLVQDVLGGRLAFRLSQSDPFFQNGCGGAPPISQRGRTPVCGERPLLPGDTPIPEGLKKIVGNRDVWAARGQLLFQPVGTDMEWTLNGHGSRRDQDGTFGQAIGVGPQGNQFGGPTNSGYQDRDQRAEQLELRRAIGRSAGDAALAKNLAQSRPLDREPYRGDFRQDGHNKLDTWGTFLRGQTTFGDVDFSTTTGYDGFDRFTAGDTDFTPDRLFEITQKAHSWQLTQDYKLAKQVTQTLHLEGGAYYLMEDLHSDQLLEQNIASLTVRRIYTQNLWSAAGYLNFGLDLGTRFLLEGGVRYNWEHKIFDIKEFRPLIPTLAPIEADNQRIFQAPTGGLSLTYFLSDEVSTYWKYTRGWKSGHFNSNAVYAQPEPGDTVLHSTHPAKPEVIDSFEWGVKGAGLAGRFHGTAAVFYYNYQDYQVFLFEDNPNSVPTLEVINAHDAQVLGAELDGELRPLQDLVPSWLEELVFSFRGGWLDTEFLDFHNTVFRTSGTGAIFPLIADYTGNPLPNAPRFQFSGGARWTFDFGRYGTLTPRYDFSWQDDVYFDATKGRGSLRFDGTTDKPEFTSGQPAYWLHNVRLTWAAPEGQFQIAGWCRNVADQRYKTYAFDASNFEKLVVNFVGDPRSCGGDVSFQF